MKSFPFNPCLYTVFLLLPGILLANPITSSELPEQALEKGVTFPQIFSLLAVLMITQVLVVACIWILCLLVRKAKENAKPKPGSWQDDLPSADQSKNDEEKE
ncbi:MAG: hypothetical protein PHY82_02910 [Lentisphaeria bacterium]|jgi:hypothetical protein|nr:hypothetical protein [Lentisphaeria bacterium]